MLMWMILHHPLIIQQAKNEAILMIIISSNHSFAINEIPDEDFNPFPQ